MPVCCTGYSTDAPLNNQGRWNGFGKVQFTSGAVYEGQWLDGQMHGQGKINFPDGISYEGTFTRSAMTGNGVRHPEKQPCKMHISAANSS